MDKQNFKRQECPDCHKNKFHIDTESDAEVSVDNLTDIENNVVDSYTVKFICSNCSFEHEVLMGSD